MAIIEKNRKEEGLILALRFRCLNRALLAPSLRSVVRKVIIGCVGTNLLTSWQPGNREGDGERQKERNGQRGGETGKATGTREAVMLWECTSLCQAIFHPKRSVLCDATGK